ncbi:MAG TPA: hypothetical protein V6C85_21195 [Allocoleopsis sp.]
MTSQESSRVWLITGSSTGEDIWQDSTANAGETWRWSSLSQQV